MLPIEDSNRLEDRYSNILGNETTLLSSNGALNPFDESYARDKTSYKDDCFNLTNDLNKDDNFFDPNSSKTQPSSSSYLAPERINLVEPQEMEKSGFVGEAGEVSYDEGLSWHPIQPINENSNDAEIDISSFDPLDVGGGDGRR